MAGVSGPLSRQRPGAAARFLLGLAGGGLLAGLLVALAAWLLGTVVGALLPASVRWPLLAAICLVLGVADMIDRTPHVWRQVPQALVRRLRPGVLGMAWGFDLGLLVTTQKTASLIWVALAAAVLVQPASAPVMVTVVAVLASLSIAVASVGLAEDRILRLGREDAWRKRLRLGTGVVSLALAVLATLQAVSA